MLRRNEIITCFKMSSFFQSCLMCCEPLANTFKGQGTDTSGPLRSYDRSGTAFLQSWELTKLPLCSRNEEMLMQSSQKIPSFHVSIYSCRFTITLASKITQGLLFHSSPQVHHSALFLSFLPSLFYYISPNLKSL